MTIESTKPKTQEDREKDLQEEIYRLQALIRVMANHIGGEFLTTSFVSRDGQLRIYTYSSGDDPGSIQHAKSVASLLKQMGVDFTTLMRNTTTNEEEEL